MDTKQRAKRTSRSHKPDASALRAEFWAAAPEALFDRDTVAAVRYMAPASVEAEAIRGGGPLYTRIGRRALYRKADLLAWMESKGRTVENTAQLKSVVQA
jgi:hypothetical protein